MYHYTRDSSDKLQIELVDGNSGQPLLQRPVCLEDLLAQENHTLPIGNGVSLRLEELQSGDDVYADVDAESSMSDSASEDESTADCIARACPPGTEEAGGWYDVLNALRNDQAATAHPPVPDGSHHWQASTPAKVFHVSQDRYKSIGHTIPAETEGKSRRDVWASFAVPAPIDCNYKRMEYVSVMGDPLNRRFRPRALSFHAVAAYLNKKDKGQRVLVYGGVSSAGRRIECELFEFSLLTGSWRRIEGKQLVPAGHMGHAMTIVEAVDRLVVIGGVGPGGLPVDMHRFAEDPRRAARAKLLLPAAAFAQPKAAYGIGSTALVPPSSATAAASIGFVPYIFDMELGTHRWRAIQTAQPLPLIFHSAVTFRNEVFVFGGLTDNLVVSSQLLAIDVSTYAVRLVSDARRDTLEPEPRYCHSAVRYGNYMLVYGGYDSQNECRDDTWAFDFVNERWERLQCTDDTPPRAGHTATVLGSRMVVLGGFTASLEESAGEECSPVNEVMDLVLVPTMTGEHRWRRGAKTRPLLPPLAFTAAASCGDECSVLCFGGLTTRPAKASKGRRQSRGSSTERQRSLSRHRPASATRRGLQHPGGKGDEGTTQSFLNRLLTLDDCLVLTYPAKVVKALEGSEERHVNELGVEVDPEEIPEHFKVFLKRQEDFLRKKNVSIEATQRKMTLEEQESMEPALYLTPEEIEMLIAKSEECCEKFTSFKMDSLPSNVPDRETRTHITEECISLSRQIRDVVKSMKGSALGVTAVRSKTHRKREGQKFEDYAAAKPFRRAAITTLVNEINRHMAHMHTLNKALRTVDWEDKHNFVKVIHQMHGGVKSFIRAVNRVMRKYIQNRVETLAKGDEQHKEVMRNLREVVERNRREKIWQENQQPYKERNRTKRQGARADSKGPCTSATRSRPNEASPATRTRSATRQHHTGTGGYGDERKTFIEILNPAWTALQHGAEKVDTACQALVAHCKEGMQIPFGTSAPPIPPAASGLLPMPIVPNSVNEAFADGGNPPAANLTRTSSEASSSTPAASLVPRLSQPPEAIIPTGGVSLLPQSSIVVSEPPTAVPAAAVGSASPRMQIIEAANARRGEVIATTESVRVAIEQFLTCLRTPSQKTATAVSSTSSLSSAPSKKEEVLPSSPRSPVAPASLIVPVVVAASSPAAPGASVPVQQSSMLQASSVEAETMKPEPKAMATADEDPAKETHTLYLSALRSLLEARDSLNRVSGKVTAITVNAWNSDDLAGAPPDTKAERLYQRLINQLAALVQGITASFLTRAGAKKPRVPPQPPAARKAAAPSPVKKTKRVVPFVSTSSSIENSKEKGLTRSRRSSSSCSTRGYLSRRSHSHSSDLEVKNTVAGPSAIAERGGPAPTSALGDMALDPQAYLQPTAFQFLGETTSAEQMAAPLFSFDALHKAPLGPCGGTPASSTPDGVVQLSDLSASATRVPNSVTTASPYAVHKQYTVADAYMPFGSYEKTGATYANDWAVFTPGKEKLPGVDYAVSPTAPALPLPTAAESDLGGVSLAAGPPLHPLPDPFSGNLKARHSVTSPLSSANPTDEGGVVLGEAPAATIAPGQFVVNAAHFYATAPSGVAPPIRATAQADLKQTGVSLSSWADTEEEDYFYFGRPAAPMGPARPHTTATERTVIRRAVEAVPVSVSPMVGTVLGSQRVNAHLRVGKLPVTQRKSSRGPTSRYRSPPQTYREPLTTSATTLLTSGSTALPLNSAAAIREEARRRKMTPGELQILQARQRFHQRSGEK